MIDLRRSAPLERIGPGPALALAEWRSLDIGDRLRAYDPVPVSSILAGLHVAAADLDVVCDLRRGGFVEAVSAAYGSHPRFAVWRTGARTVVSFEGRLMRVELVGEQRAVDEQLGYVHGVAQRRLVALGGLGFARAVRRARCEQGLKTEPAIAAVLGLSGDPYVAVARLAAAPDRELRALLTPRGRPAPAPRA